MVGILGIRQTYGQIGIDADLGQYSIRQPKADLQITTHEADMQIHQQPAEMRIDQSRAQAAYTGGGFLDVSRRMNSNIRQIFLQGIAKRVDEGNRMAQFFKPGNTIPEIIADDWHDNPFVEYRGEASSDNVDVEFTAHPTEIEVQPRKPDINVQINKPEIEYTRGKLDIYMQQYPSVQYIPPVLDTEM